MEGLSKGLFTRRHHGRSADGTCPATPARRRRDLGPEAVHVFATQVRTGDNKTITIPNGQITGGHIVNYSTKETRRVDLVFGIGYDDDLAKAKDLLRTVVTSDPRVLADPEPTIAVLELADSSVNFAVRPWVKSADYWAVYFDLTERVKLEFDMHGISIPYPQQDVYMHQVAS